MAIDAGPSRRRLCLGLAALAGAPWRSAHAAARRVGFVSGGTADEAASFLAPVRADLSRRGYAVPDSLALDLRFADGELARVPKLVADLERAGVDLIVTHAVATTIVVTGKRSVPAVYQFSADPVAAGIATDLAHPLFNATGVTLMLAEINGKRLDLVQQMLPAVRRVGVLANVLHPGQERERAVVEDKARQLGLRTSAYTTRSEAELDSALAALAAAPPDALLVLSDGFVVVHRRKILEFALARRLPVISGWALMADSGALCTYGPRLADAYARVGYFVDRILKGAATSSLPIEQPTILELVVNLKSARQLGVSIPPAVLARADRVIE
ncbi:MAG TPA: ABC transporter substrate-binding protein [Caldimonas sp.]|nr:ABC transporter substrate-binding protein [Caldimonas sp.]